MCHFHLTLWEAQPLPPRPVKHRRHGGSGIFVQHGPSSAAATGPTRNKTFGPPPATWLSRPPPQRRKKECTASTTKRKLDPLLLQPGFLRWLAAVHVFSVSHSPVGHSPRRMHHPREQRSAGQPARWTSNSSRCIDVSETFLPPRVFPTTTGSRATLVVVIVIASGGPRAPPYTRDLGLLRLRSTRHREHFTRTETKATLGIGRAIFLAW